MSPDLATVRKGGFVAVIVIESRARSGMRLAGIDVDLVSVQMDHHFIGPCIPDQLLDMTHDALDSVIDDNWAVDPTRSLSICCRYTLLQQCYGPPDTRNDHRDEAAKADELLVHFEVGSDRRCFRESGFVLFDEVSFFLVNTEL